MGVCNLGCSNDLLHGRILDTEGYVVEYCVVEQDRFLIYIAYEASEVLDSQVFQVRSVQSDGSFACIIISGNKIGKGGFSGTGLSYKGDGLALRYFKIHFMENLLSFLITE